MPIVGTLPFNIQAGQLVSAAPVMGNYNFLHDQVNANAVPNTGPATLTGAYTVVGPLNVTGLLTLSPTAGNPALAITMAGAAALAINVTGPAATQINPLIFQQSGQSQWQIYQPASSSDFRIFGNSADRLVITNVGGVTLGAASGITLTLNGASGTNALTVNMAGANANAINITGPAATQITPLAFQQTSQTQWIIYQPASNSDFRINASGVGDALRLSNALNVTLGPTTSGSILTLNNNSTVASLSVTGAASTQLSVWQFQQSGQNLVQLYQEAGSGNFHCNINSVGDAFFFHGTTHALDVSGTNTNDNVTAGFVGETITASNTAGSALTNGTNLNVTSISVTAGDWDIGGGVQFSSNANTTLQQVGISSTSQTLPGIAFTSAMTCTSGTVGGQGTGYACVSQRFSLSSTTTIFLVAVANFSAGSCNATGTIIARRRR